MLDPTGGMLAFLAEAGVMFVAKVGWNIGRLVRVVRQGRLVHRRLVHRAVSMCCSPRAVGNRVSRSECTVGRFVAKVVGKCWRASDSYLVVIAIGAQPISGAQRRAVFVSDGRCQMHGCCEHWLASAGWGLCVSGKVCTRVWSGAHGRGLGAGVSALPSHCRRYRSLSADAAAAVAAADVTPNAHKCARNT